MRGIRRTLVQEFTNEADAFSDCLNYEKKQYEKQRRVYISNRSIIHVTPHFANTMLAVVILYL